MPKESDRQTTPQSQESKDSEWTAVDKSESDDWEQEFDIEMTEEEIKKALESVVSTFNFLETKIKKNNG